MAFLDSIRQLLFKTSSAPAMQTKAASARDWTAASMNPMDKRSDGKPPPFSQSNAIRHFSSWIYAAASINGNAVASTPLRLYIRSSGSRRKLWSTRKASVAQKNWLLGEARHQPSATVMRKAAEIGSEFEEVTDSHPLLKLMARSNPYINGYDLCVLRCVWQELTGNAYLHIVTDPAMGVPTELWPMPPHWTTIVPDEKDFITAYKYGRSPERVVDFDPMEVIHFKRPNPSDLFYGMGKLQAAWGAANANRALHEMDLAFFENKARPDYALIVKGNAGQDQLDALESQIQEKLRGTDKTGHFLITTADLDLKPLQFPLKDMQGRDEIVEEIAAVFGVPVSMLKANDPNLASAEAGFASWREMTVLPLCRMDEETLNQRLLPLFGIEGDAVLAYDNPVPKNRVLDLQERSTAVSGGWMTPNEAREAQGLEPINDNPHANMLHVGGQPLGGAAPAPGAAGEAVGAPGALGAAPEGVGLPEGLGAAPAAPEGQGAAATPADQPVANTALNGAQISSLVNLATAAKAGELPIESAKSIALAAFPSIPSEVVDAIFAPIIVQPKPAEPPTEQKPPVAPVKKAADDGCVSSKIGKLLDEGYEQDQAVAIAISMCKGKALEAALIDVLGKAVEDIDTKPPESVASNARRALEVRGEKPESERGMTEVGIARARDLANRAELSEDTIRRMVAYFERHEVDKRGETWDEQGKGWQAWNGWGGDEGWSWAKRKVEEFDRARESKGIGPYEQKNCGTGAGGFQPGNDCGRGEGGDGSDKPRSGTRDAKVPKLRANAVRELAVNYSPFSTLEDTNSGADFAEMAVWDMRDMINHAYSLGQNAAGGDGTKRPSIERAQKIARQANDKFSNLTTQNRDALDFHEVSRSSIKDVIEAAYRAGADDASKSKSMDEVEVEQKDCGTGAGGFKPGNDCGRRDGSSSGGSPKRGAPRSSTELIEEAPDTKKGAATWQRQAAKAYETDPEFAAFADAVSLYTQGGYQELQRAAREMDDGNPPDATIASATFPMASYKPMVEGQDLEKSTVKLKDAVTALRKAIGMSKPVAEMSRGIRWPGGEAQQALGKLMTDLKPGDDFDFKVPTSFTADRSIAEKFAQGTNSGSSRRQREPGNGVVFVVKGGKGVRAAALSPWNQREVISEGKFKVVSVDGERPTKYEDFGGSGSWYGWPDRDGKVRMVITLEPR